MFQNSNRRIYLDYASLTPIDPRVIREISSYSKPMYANPSSLHTQGVAAKNVLIAARRTISDFIHAQPDEIICTSGGTESNILALEGSVRAALSGGIQHPHIVISAVEHASVRETVNHMKKHGVEVTEVPVDVHGVVDLGVLKNSIKMNTVLVSILAVHNETGVVQPIRDIMKIVRRARKDFGHSYPLMHTDASQGALYHELFVEKLGVDLMTLDGAKVYGPRGIGCLYIRRGVSLQPIIYGGGQEGGMRSGTENIPSIAGFAKALKIAEAVRTREKKRIARLKQFFLTELIAIAPHISINSPDTFTDMKSGQIAFEGYAVSPHILNVLFPGFESEFLVFQLDAKGIACSTKSSCLRDEDESYVLKAMGVESAYAVRFSFGRWTTMADIRKTLAVLGVLFAYK